MIPYSPWLSWLIPILGSLLVPIIARINGKLRDWSAFIFVAVSAVFTLSMLPDTYTGYSADIQLQWIPQLNLSVGVLVDSLSVFMASVVSCIGALILLYSIGYMAHEEGLTRYYFFMLLFIGGMIGLVMADNFIQLYIFWEIVGLCSYALIGFWYKRPEAVKAGMKAFIVTRVGDIFLLLGIITLYSNTGQFSFLTIKNDVTLGLIGVSSITTVALLMFGGAIGKSAQIPLFVWLPDAMEGPTTVSALIHAATMVKAGVYLVARIATIFPPSPDYQLVVAGVGVVTAFIASTMALVNFDIKRVLAYSTVSQLGYMFFSLGLGTVDGWFASQFHLLSHALFKALLFLCVGAVIHITGTRDMRMMGGLRRYMPITFATFIVGALSLSAIPPFNGFWSKDLILTASYRSGSHIGYLLFFFGTATAAITFVYTIRMVAFTFLGEESPFLKRKKLREAPLLMTAPLIILASACIISGFLGYPFMHLMSQTLPMGIPQFTESEAAPLFYSLIALLVGGLPAYMIYVKKAIPPERFTEGTISRIFYNVLVNDYYFDRFYSYIFVNGMSYISSRVRKIQTGLLNLNMLAVLIGLLSLLILMLHGAVSI